MARRPYVLLSAAMSADGYLDDATDQRLILSDAADLDRVDEVRAGSDAILVGGATIRRDNPGLRVRSAARRKDRLRRGLPASPARVTLTAGGDLDPAARFFADDGIDKLVYTPAAAAGQARERLGSAATVIGCGDPLSLPRMLADLAGRGVGVLMVEGGVMVLSQFLAARLADEFQLAVAPLLVADEAAPRLLSGVGDVSVLGDADALGDLGGLGDLGALGDLAGLGDLDSPRLAEPRLTGVSHAGRMVVLRYQRTEGTAG
ncbi:MAG TPA: dihydrofolate reductase family protein [Streptosporangiaceae bacterium]|nr:dihydrofolate reductase family protein [Streptosporangiaceae bacterium]